MTYLLIAIGLVTISIFLHELGHFLVARWRGLVVPRFSIFGIGKPMVSWKWRGVEYCICWLPIGAYVMVPQLSDMGDFEGEIPEEARGLPPADYVSKVLVAIAGPAANILFAFALACVIWLVGVKVPVEFNRTEIGDLDAQLITNEGKTVRGPAAAAGLQPGDIIRKIDNQTVANFTELMNAIVFGAQVAPDGRRVTTIEFERNGVTQTRQVFPELAGPEGLRAIGIGPRPELVIGTVQPDAPAAAAGLRPGDVITAVDGKPLLGLEDLAKHLQTKNTEPSLLAIKRGGKEVTASVLPRKVDVDGKPVYRIGIVWHRETVVIHPTPFTQIRETIRQVYQTLTSLLNRKSDIKVSHMSGVVGMVDNLQQAASAGLVPAFGFLLAINISLAVFNLLPIPVLDGGHVLFATLARLRGRPLSPAVMQNAVGACFVMLIGLVLYVTYNDIRRGIRDRFDERGTPAAPAAATPPEISPAPAKP